MPKFSIFFAEFSNFYSHFSLIVLTDKKIRHLRKSIKEQFNFKLQINFHVLFWRNWEEATTPERIWENKIKCVKHARTHFNEKKNFQFRILLLILERWQLIYFSTSFSLQLRAVAASLTIHHTVHTALTVTLTAYQQPLLSRAWSHMSYTVSYRTALHCTAQ